MRTHAELAESAKLKSIVLGTNYAEYVVEPDGCVVLTQAVEIDNSSKFTILPFIDYVRSGAFDGTYFKEIYIENNSQKPFDNPGLFCGIQSKHLKVRFKYPEQVTSFNSWFCDCNILSSVDLGDAGYENVVDMENMFRGCLRLKSIDLSHLDTRKVITMSSMFEDCNSLVNIDLSNFQTTSLTWTESMFAYCSSLTTVLLPHFDTSGVRNMGAMFNLCESLTELDLSSFTLHPDVDMYYMFYKCKNLTALNISNMHIKDSFSDLTCLFSGCDSLVNLVTSDRTILDAYYGR